MKVYFVDDVDAALLCRQLIQLGADCAKLQWSKQVTDIPETVYNALSTVQSFAEEKLHELCPEENLAVELTEDEENAVVSVGKSSEQLRKTVGSGVVLAGIEATELQQELLQFAGAECILELLDCGKSLTIL